ncbi:MAG: hypothetical protein HXO23_04830 [Prevotella sp.]|nr:hypothetical protein [Prevotella sp.]
MNKITQILQSVAMMAVVVLAGACANHDDIDNVEARIEKGITIQEENFAANRELTRAALPAPQQIDLGDGVMAEVTFERNNDEAKKGGTRAAMSNEHYTIYAFDGSGHLKGKLAGVVSGGGFIRDASTQVLELEPGTYTFVCVNDAVTYQNGKFEVTKLTENPMIDKVTKTLTTPHLELSFVMKHQAARIKTKITSYTNEGKNIKACVSATAVQPKTNFYDVDGTTLLSTDNEAIAANSNALTVPESPVTASPYVQTFVRESGFEYFLPQTNGAQLTLGFAAGSKIYGKDLSTKTISLAGLGMLNKNDSYTVNLKLKTFPYYLYQDGTIGAIGDKGTRTPIALVISEKTQTEKGLAVALKDAFSETDAYDFFHHYGGELWLDAGPSFLTMDGYESTWTTKDYKPGATPHGPGDYDDIFNLHKAPADLDLDQLSWSGASLGAYIYVGHYEPGVAITGSNISKWFMPSLRAWVLFAKTLGKADVSTFPTIYECSKQHEKNYDFGVANTMVSHPESDDPYQIVWDSSKLVEYFTQAGGIFYLNESYASTGTATDSGNIRYGIFMNALSNCMYFSASNINFHPTKLRSFVYF